MPPTSSRHIALWQTTFWGIAAIALSTCLQPCGKVCEIQKEFALLIRSSPIFCFADSLIITFQLAFYTVKKGPKGAMQIVAKCRDQHSVEDQNVTTKPVSWLIYGLLLALAIVQSIKVFALRGIPWTQFFAACYLVSYALNALLNIFGKPPPELNLEDVQLPQREEIVPKTKFIILVSDCTCLVQISLWTVALRPVVPASLLTDWCSAPLHLLTGLIYALPAALISFIPLAVVLTLELAVVLVPPGLLYLCLIFKPLENTPSVLQALSGLFNASPGVVTAALLVPTSCILIVFRCKWPSWILIVLLESDAFESLVIKLFQGGEFADPYLVTLTLIMLTAFFSHIVARVFLFGTLAEKLRLRQLPVTSGIGWASMFLFAADVGFGLLYYSQAYDPTNIYKPLWLENLGRSIHFQL